ncbi:MAG: hypothetical protein J2P24_06685 [Streptosporangiales bacterium]|nr:hypothetical protein [Streptosporangiales bacterium]MBO0891258.1 hypothetical protein [Acidothermales bacterium]
MSEQQPWQPPGGTPAPQGRPQYGQPPQGQQPYGQAPSPGPAYGAAPPAPGRAPTQVRVAGILLLVQIVLGDISTIVFLPSTYRRMLAQQPAQPGVDPQLMQTLVTAVMAATIVISLIWLVAWVLFVVKAWQGRNWARVVLTVFLAVSLVSVVFTPFAYAQETVSRAQLPFAVVGLAIAVVVLLLFWRQPAKGWYEANSAYKQATGTYPRR